MRDDLKNLREKYEKGENILSYIKQSKGLEHNTSDAIAISYDLQAGSYVEFTKNNPEYENERATTYSEILNNLGGFKSIIEVGIGDGTTFLNIIRKLKQRDIAYGGFDISYSRVKCCQKHLKENGIEDSVVFMGDLFHSPIKSNSVDIVYTNHALEPNGMNEKNALKELYRITKKYLVLFEPYFESTNASTREHIVKHGYVKNLYSTAIELGYKVIECREIFSDNITGNNTGLLLIEKKCQDDAVDSEANIELACSVTGESLKPVKGNYYSQESLLLYPVVDEVPCLLPGNAIIATHYLDDL